MQLNQLYEEYAGRADALVAGESPDSFIDDLKSLNSYTCPSWQPGTYNEGTKGFLIADRFCCGKLDMTLKGWSPAEYSSDIYNKYGGIPEVYRLFFARIISQTADAKQGVIQYVAAESGNSRKLAEVLMSFGFQEVAKFRNPNNYWQPASILLGTTARVLLEDKRQALLRGEEFVHGQVRSA
jgi:hypothetical protein